MAEEKAAAPAPEASAPAAGGGNKLVMILSLVNIVATLAILGLLFVSFQKEKSATSVADIDPAAGEHAAADAKGGEHGGGGGGEHGAAAGKKDDASGRFGKMVTLDQFTVNLATPGSSSPKFVRVNISIEVPTNDSESELNQKMPQVRNIIIDLFNSKRAQDLATPESREFLKDEIKNALNGFMVTGKVRGVFFTSFAVTS